MRANSVSTTDRKKSNTFRDKIDHSAITSPGGVTSSPRAPPKVFGAPLEKVMAKEREHDPTAHVPRVVKEGEEEAFSSFFILFHCVFFSRNQLHLSQGSGG